MPHLASLVFSLAALPTLLAGAGALPAAIANVSSSEAVSQPAEAEAPKLLVVKYHADWCGKCKALARPLSEAKSALAEKPVLFLDLDFTDATTAKQSEYLASLAGLGDAWAEYERRTGFALLIEPGTGRVITMLGDPDARAIIDAVESSL